MVPEQTLPLVRFFSSVGDPDDLLLHSLFYTDENCLDSCLIKYCDHTKYAGNLRFILIEFYVEGERWNPIGIDTLKGASLRYISYHKKEQIATVAAYLKRSEFHLKTPAERRQVVASKVLESVNLIREKLGAKKVRFDFDALFENLDEALLQFCVANSSAQKQCVHRKRGQGANG
jgi:hypothetical protein